MSAIEWIKGGKAKGVKQRKLGEEQTWSISGSVLSVDQAPVGEIVWERSRYLKKGGNVNFYGFVSGTMNMYVCPRTQEVGYVTPAPLKWGMPIPADEGEDE